MTQRNLMVLMIVSLLIALVLGLTFSRSSRNESPQTDTAQLTTSTPINTASVALQDQHQLTDSVQESTSVQTSVKSKHTPNGNRAAIQRTKIQSTKIQSPINIQLVDEARKLLDETNLANVFKDGILNDSTLTIANALLTAFNQSTSDLIYHSSEIENFLRERSVNEFTIQEFMGFYNIYCAHEADKMNNPNSLWQENPMSAEEAIQLAKNKQAQLQKLFGEEAAGKLWGADSKNQEDALRKQTILNNELLNADEKEQKLNDLSAAGANIKSKSGSTASNSSTINSSTINRMITNSRDEAFYNQLAIHGEELLNMTDEEREIRIQEIRDAIYSEE